MKLYTLVDDVGVWLERRLEVAARWLAWRLPRRLVYWCAVRVVAYATLARLDGTDRPALTTVEALERWEEQDDEVYP